MSATCDLAEARPLLKLVHPEERGFVLSAVVNDGLIPRYVADPGAVERIVLELVEIQKCKKAIGIYYGLAEHDAAPKNRGAEHEVSRVRCCYSDVDKPDKTTAGARLKAFVKRTQLAPSVLIDTGAGYQCLWLFREPVEVGPFPKGEYTHTALRVRAVNAALAREQGGDPTIDLARVFRLAGTMNTKCNAPEKYPDYTEPLQCRIVEAHAGRRYTLEDLERFVTEADRRKASKKPAKAEPSKRRAAPEASIDLDDADLIARAKRADNGAKLAALYRGDTSAYDGDDSRADLALCCHLAFWTSKDPVRMDRLFRGSGLCRDKWTERADYRDRTITRAIEQTREVFTVPAGRQTPGRNGKPTQRHATASAGAEKAHPKHAEVPPNAIIDPARILIVPGNGVTITETATDLYQRIAPTHDLFIRGGAVMRVIQDQQGDLKLEPVRPAGARSLFEQYGSMMAWRSGAESEPVLKPVVLAEDMARALLESETARKFLPAIEGLVNCPLIIGEGEIVGPGYHEETRLLITGGEYQPEVPLSEAVDSLKELVVEFDFQSDGDRSRALALSITPALKQGGHLRGNTPTDVAEANKSQSGKTYRQKVVAAVYNEKPSLVTCRVGGVGSVDESLNEQLIAGRPFIQLDNFRGRFDSPHIEALLTSERRFPVRVPHCREVEIDPSRFFVFLTSNGIETTRDFANRSSIVRIRKREGHAFRQYPEGDLLDHVRANQPYYLGCVFAIVREWIAKGRQSTKEMRHDFREWCQTLDWIVQCIFHEAPLMDGHEDAQERVSNPALTFLRKLALAVAEQGRLGEPLIASQLYEIADSADVNIPGLHEPDEDKGKRVIGSVMARLFKGTAAINTDGFIVERKEITVQREDGGDYVAKTYTFAFDASIPHSAQRAQHVKGSGKPRGFPGSIERCAPCAEAPNGISDGSAFDNGAGFSATPDDLELPHA